MVLKDQEKRLRKYLLGELSEREQEALELWLMSEEEAYDLLSAAEDDLIDESIAGKLDRYELERFNNQFLTAPERKRKLSFSQSLQEFVTEHGPGTHQEAPARSTFWDLFRRQPALAYSLAAFFILFMGGGIWGGLQYRNLQEEFTAAETQFAVEREAFKRQLEAERDRAQSDYRDLERAVQNVKSAPVPEAPLALALMPGVTRSPEELHTLKLRPTVQLVELSLTLLDDNYDSYRAVLVDGSGTEIWTRDRLPATTGENKAVVLLVPTNRLTADDYIVRLSGRSGSNPPENINSYSFRATR
jgi:hypothetical protein